MLNLTVKVQTDEGDRNAKKISIEDDLTLSQLICKRLNDYGFYEVEMDRFYHAIEEFNNLLPDIF